MTSVLLVDDEPEHLVVWSMLLSDSGYEVQCARDGAEALDLLEQRVPDLIITDWMMPRLNGADLCEHLKARPDWPRFPVIVHTGTCEQFRQQANVAYDACLDKPASLPIVLTTIEQLCSGPH